MSTIVSLLNYCPDSPDSLKSNILNSLCLKKLWSSQIESERFHSVSQHL